MWLFEQTSISLDFLNAMPKKKRKKKNAGEKHIALGD